MFKVSVHAFIEAMDCLPLSSFPSIISVSAETLTMPLRKQINSLIQNILDHLNMHAAATLSHA